MNLPYGILNAKSPEYEGAVWQELQDLYVGGYQLERNAARYLPQFSREHKASYRDRLRCVGYISYLGQIVDYFAAALFASDLTVTDAADANDPTTAGDVAQDDVYGEFLKDSDRRGTPFARVMRQAFATAILKRKALIAIDFPAPEMDVMSRLEEDSAGLSRPYAYEIPVEQMLDWEYIDEDNDSDVDYVHGMSWCIIKRTVHSRSAPEQKRGKCVDEFKIWRRADDGAITWELYRTAPYDQGRPPSDPDLIPLVVEPQLTSFYRIPIIEICVPDGLWVGNKIGTLAKEHFQRRSALVAAENKSLVSIPYVKLGPQAPAIGGEIQADVAQDQSRGDDPIRIFSEQGYLTLTSEDDLGFAEPEGKAYDLVDKQLTSLKDEMFRVVHQMAASVDNKSSRQRASAESKSQDRAAEAIVLSAYGDLMRDGAVRIFDVIAEGRGDDIVWQAHGLDDFDTSDRALDLEEALALDSVQIPSATFMKTLKTRVAFRLLGPLDPRTRAVIAKEIEEGVEHAEELKAHEQEEAEQAEENAEGDIRPIDSEAMGEPASPKRVGNAPSGESSTGQYPESD